MKGLLISIIVILSIFMLFSCDFQEMEDSDKLPSDLENINIYASDEKSIIPVGKDLIEGSENMDISNEKQPSYTLKAIVKNVTSEHIEVEVIESDYAFGIYWILTSGETKYLNSNGSYIQRSNIKIGNTIEITYSGQTMLSYPPQVVAYTIKQL